MVKFSLQDSGTMRSDSPLEAPQRGLRTSRIKLAPMNTGWLHGRKRNPESTKRQIAEPQHHRESKRLHDDRVSWVGNPVQELLAWSCNGKYESEVRRHHSGDREK